MRAAGVVVVMRRESERVGGEEAQGGAGCRGALYGVCF